MYAVCSFIYIFVSRSFPLPPAFLSTKVERGKVFGLITLRKRKNLTETACRLTFQLSNSFCTTFANEQRKGVNDGIEKSIISQIKDRPITSIQTYTMKSSPSFCLFLKKLYLCIKMSCTSMPIMQVCRNQNGCQLVILFSSIPNNRLILRQLQFYRFFFKKEYSLNPIKLAN